MNDSSSSTTSTVADGSAIRILPVAPIVAVEGRPREPQGEGRPVAFTRLHRDPAAVVVGHVTHDRKAESGTAGISGASPVDPVEPLEDAVEVPGRNADPVIAHR